MFNKIYTNLSIAIENKIYTDSFSQFANDKSVLFEDIYNQKSCYNNVNVNVEKSVKWLVRSCIFHDTHYISNGWTCDLPPNGYIYQNMLNIKLYSVNEIIWLVGQSKVLDSDYLNYPCHEGSTAGWAAFIMKNNIKTSNISTVVSCVYMQPNTING